MLKAIAKVSAAEGESSEGDTIEPSSSFFATDLSFFHHQMHGKENMKLPLLKRFHFISDGRSEIIYYAANVLIRCLHVVWILKISLDSFLSICLTARNQWFRAGIQMNSVSVIF